MRIDPLALSDECKARNMHLDRLGKLLRFTDCQNRIAEFVAIRWETSICGIEFWAMTVESHEEMALDGCLENGAKIDLEGIDPDTLFQLARRHKVPIRIVNVDYS